MDLDKIIQFIPDLLLYIIPGFISLRIKEKYGFKKKQSELSCILYSILYSFVVLIIFTLLKIVFPCVRNVLPGKYVGDIKRIVFIILGILWGLAITVVPRLEKWQKVIGFFFPHYSPEQTVWEKAITNRYGAKAKVLLKNNMIYEGVLGYGTGEPEEQDRTVLILNYKSCYRREDSKNEYIMIKENIKKVNDEEDMEKVYISPDEIVTIEIEPVTEKEYKGNEKKDDNKEMGWFKRLFSHKNAKE